MAALTEDPKIDTRNLPIRITMLELGLVGSIILAGVLILMLRLDLRKDIYQTLAFTWIPASIWLTMLVVSLRIRPRSVLRSWRRWLGWVGLISLVGGLLSWFDAGGMLQEIGMGGTWGAAIGGATLLGVFKLIVLAALTGGVFFPKITKRIAYKAALSAKSGLPLAAQEANRRMATVGELIDARLGGQSNDEPDIEVLTKDNQLATWETVPVPAVITHVSQNDSVELSLDEAPHAQSPSIATFEEWEIEGTDGSGRLDWFDTIEGDGAENTTETVTVPTLSLDAIARRIESVLGDHGLKVEINDIKEGPRTVLFGLVPGWSKPDREKNTRGGMATVESIIRREKDLALALKTSHLRILAPVPGEALVGLEVPNPNPRNVSLQEVVDDQSFKSIATKGGLPIAVGLDTSGNPVSIDLAKVQAVLIGGRTGSGKSVFLNALIASFLTCRSPSQLKLLLVDPKMVELTSYNSLPHLLAPVVVDMEMFKEILGKLTIELKRRFSLLQLSRSRDIEAHNAKTEEKLPHIVLVVDELADVMAELHEDAEEPLSKIAAMGRAAGIHLVLCTQRPSVNAIPGKIKANLPARIAFATASGIDSRIILDQSGAEKLLGSGDCLLVTPDAAKPVRVQATFVSDDEIEKLVDSWAKRPVSSRVNRP